MDIFTTQDQRAEMIPEPVHKILDLLNRGHGYPPAARIAGGAVRDSLMGVQPKDWDIATVLRPETVTSEARKAGFNVIETGLKHGTVTVVIDGEPIEVTTLRIDVETTGRHAEVEFTTDWQEDAARRDLTINAMFMNSDGSVVDFFGGKEDLATGRVRFVGDARERLEEDYLRILRFFRFHSKIGSSDFSQSALLAIHNKVHGLTKISGERIWMEMQKILTGKVLRPVLESMEETGVLSSIGIKNPNIGLAEVANEMGGDSTTVLAGLLGGDERAAENVAERWKLTKKERALLLWLTERIREGGANPFRLMDLLDLQKVAVTHGKEKALALSRLAPDPQRHTALADWEPPEFPLTGADLVKSGIPQGPEVGRKLRAAKQAWLDSNLNLDKRELLRIAMSA